ncbi:MAG TPA: CHRD domain-containing protein [Gemmatimonadales bacterium]|nr:CHRD domain-containing protein [Gemmatimonadales bacterium]
MRERLVLGTLTLAAVLAVGSCKDDVGLTSIPPDPERFIAFLNGANEPTAVATPALGQAVITVDGNSLIYRIDVSNIDNATAAHIHKGFAGQNGGVMVPLFGGPATAVDFSGVLVEDTVVVVDSVLTHMRGGQAYVNVHTTSPGCTPGTPGCNVGGEIRGQVFRFQ